MRLKIIPVELELKRTFTISRGSTSRKQNTIAVLDDIGLGEAAGSVYYGATWEEIRLELESIAERIIHLDETRFPTWLQDNAVVYSPPAMCALSAAYHDLMAKKAGIPLCQRLGLDMPENIRTSITISIGDYDAIEYWLNQGCTLFKVKMENDPGAATELANIIKRYDISIRIDANGSWDDKMADIVLAALPEKSIDCIEQPFEADCITQWQRLRSRTAVPILVDESISNAEDVARAAQFADGINIKLQKSGLLETAVKALQEAKKRGMKTMIGCMLESSVGIATGYQLTSLVDFVDLDSRLLIKADPFTGLSYNRDLLVIDHTEGHGVTLP